ncbi:hypothetical protein ABT297_35900 [Dactylosporangium sp. NPDC000555]|uniref:hypothetical protein n=1 Tax=Dactylosporangium sp. NPDC000555 TaxID=3154260 RepID=UPI00331FA902
MTYPGSPQGNPNEGYGYPNPNAPAGAYPPPAPGYGEQPAPQYGQPVPQQPQPVHDQSTTQLPTYGEASYSLDPSVSAPPTSPVHQPVPPMAAPPMSAPPMSGPPMSGPPTAYGPVSGPPIVGLPGQPTAYPPIEPPKKRGVAVPLLASLLALAVIAAGVFVGLYVDKSNKLTSSETQSAQRQTSLDTSNKDLEQTRSDLKAKADELTKSQQDLRGTQADSTEAKRQRDVVGKCLTLLLDALAAAYENDKATYQSKFKEADKPCNEARVILGI